MVDGEPHADASRFFAISAPYLELPQEFSIREIHKLYRDLKKTDHNLEAFLEFSDFSSAQAGRPVKHFSSGMLQRLKTALCIHSNAPVLLLDEPLTNMDKQGEDWYGNCLPILRSRICIVAGNHPAEYDWTGSTLQLM
jgi:ABC-type multidrug transport system ATPase subunit